MLKYAFEEIKSRQKMLEHVKLTVSHIGVVQFHDYVNKSSYTFS